jgi:hypothetical protein
MAARSAVQSADTAASAASCVAADEATVAFVGFGCRRGEIDGGFAAVLSSAATANTAAYAHATHVCAWQTLEASAAVAKAAERAQLAARAAACEAGKAARGRSAAQLAAAETMAPRAAGCDAAAA